MSQPLQRTLVLTVIVTASGCSTVLDRPSIRVESVPANGETAIADQRGRQKLVLARRQLEADDFEAAARTGKTLIADHPLSAEAHVVYGLASLGVAMEPVREARARAAKGNSKQEPVVPDLTELDEAETSLLSAVKLAPRMPEAQTALADLYYEEGHLEAALAGYRKALELSAFHRPALLRAAELATDLGLERSAAIYLEGLRTQPDFPTKALVWETQVYLSLADARDQIESRTTYLTRALRAFRELKARQPGKPLAVLGEAHCRFLLMRDSGQKLTNAQIDQLRKLYLEAARLDPTDPVPRYNLGRVLEDDLVGRREAAIESYRAALDRSPTHLPSLLNLARLLWEDGKRDEATGLYRRALPLMKDTDERKYVERLLAGR